MLDLYHNNLQILFKYHSNIKKRETREDDESDEESGEKDKKRLDSIKEEEDNLGSDDLRLLDDSIDTTNTQLVQEAMKKALKEAEAVEVDIGTEDLDESLQRDEQMDREVLQRKIKTKDDLLHIRNSKLSDQEAEIGELKTVQDQLTLTIKKVREKAKKELEEKEVKVKEMMAKIAKLEKRASSPGKESLKEDMEKATVKINNMSNRIVNLTKDLKNATKDRRKAEVDNGNYEKMKVSLEKTMLEMEDLQREMEGYKREVAKANKRIPCTKKDCNNPRECEFSHHLRYELRSEPKEQKWEKRVPCRFQNYPGGCYKSAEECKFLHVSGGARGSDRTEHREPSIEVISEAGPSWAMHTREKVDQGRRPPTKKPRVSQGNEGGTVERPNLAVPRTSTSRRSSVTSSGSTGGPARRRTGTPRTPQTQREREWTRSRSRSNSRGRDRDTRRMGQEPRRHEVQDPLTSRPRDDRTRSEYSRPRNQGRR